MRSARGFVGLVLVVISSTALLVAAGTGAVSLGLQYREMRESTSRLREEFLTARRQLLEQETARALRYTEHLRDAAGETTLEELRGRVAAVAALVRSTQARDPLGDRTPLPPEAEARIADAVAASSKAAEPGALFALTREGRCVLFAGRDDLRGVDLSDVMSVDGQYVIRELQYIAQHEGEGICSLRWTPPGDDAETTLDATFVRRLEGLGWILCAGARTADIEEALQRRALDYIDSVRFGTAGYLFAGRWDGAGLTAASTEAGRRRRARGIGEPSTEELIRVAQRGGGFIESSIPPTEDEEREARLLTYVRPIADWEWYLGATLSIDDIDAQVAARETGPRRSMALSMVVTACAGLAVALIGLAGGVCFSRALAREASVFGGWFRQARTALQEIDVEELHFQEFRDLAEDANAMVRTRRQAEKRQRELEEALQQNQRLESIGVLAGGIAHGFNNLLAAILGYGELALRKVPEESGARSDLRNILVAAERARDLVRQILSFSRRAPLDFRPVALRPLLDEAVRLLRATIPSSIEIRYREEGENPVAFADSAQVHQVILNLCANAQHAMKETGGVLELSLESEQIDSVRARQIGCFAPGLYARLIVRDTGCGMDQGTMAKVFEPFFTTKGPGEGTGLGLSFSHGVITSHGGTMTVESRVGQGTTFCVYLPCVELTEDLNVGPSEAIVPTRAVPILLVDDDPALLDACIGMLTVLGHEVEAFSDGPQALELLRAEPGRFELLMTDQTMPRMSGLQLADLAKQANPDLRVLLVTGFSPEADAESARAQGIEGFLMKPFTLSQLSARINEILAAPTATLAAPPTAAAVDPKPEPEAEATPRSP